MKKKHLFFKFMAGVLILALFNVYGFSRLVHNGVGGAFEEGEGEGEAASATSIRTVKSSIENNIIDAAGHLLNSYSTVLRLLNRVELEEVSGADYTELQVLVNSSIYDLEKARNQYFVIASKAYATPYNPGFVEKLKNFDYFGFRKGYGLNEQIFSRVEKTLGKGDVRSLFPYYIATLDHLLGQLYMIDAYVEYGILPPVDWFWKLNQDFGTTMLFGQYTAQVFYAVSGK